MKTSSHFSEMWKFHFDRKIVCSDGEAGSLAHVVFDAAAQRLTHLGVRQSPLFGRTVDPPYDTVVEATGDGVMLGITRAELAAASGVGVGKVVLDRHSLVERAGSADNGTLLLLAVHPESGALAYLVVGRLRPGGDTLLQEQYVTRMAQRHVTVALPEATLNALAPYRSDDELLQDVRRVLFDLACLHINLQGMNLRALDGVLYLEGNISSQLRADIVEGRARAVPGLLEIKNHLVGDDRLVADLTKALSQDMRTRDMLIGVSSRLGEVRLSGSAYTGQQKAAAEEIVRNFPGVRSAIYELVVDPWADLRPLMLAAGVAAEDKVHGRFSRYIR